MRWNNFSKTPDKKYVSWTKESEDTINIHGPQLLFSSPKQFQLSERVIFISFGDKSVPHFKRALQRDARGICRLLYTLLVVASCLLWVITYSWKSQIFPPHYENIPESYLRIKRHPLTTHFVKPNRLHEWIFLAMSRVQPTM